MKYHDKNNELTLENITHQKAPLTYIMLTNKQQKVIIHNIVLWKKCIYKYYRDINSKKGGSALIWYKPTCAHDSSGVLALTE